MDRFSFLFSESEDKDLYGRYKSFTDFVEGCCPQTNTLRTRDVLIGAFHVVLIFRTLSEPTNFGGEKKMRESPYSIDFVRPEFHVEVGSLILTGTFNGMQVFQCANIAEDELVILGSKGNAFIKIMDPFWEI
jgi:hypothetical protein